MDGRPIHGLLGAVAGGAVTAMFWFGIAAATPWAVAATLAGAALGAGCGVLVGKGRIQEAWAGAVGAVLISGIAVALANVCLIVALASHSH